LDTRLDELVKSPDSNRFVIPAKAGIKEFYPAFGWILDLGFRRGDDGRDFL
jgi:hypothetical protein